ncbi:hypothetical protein PF008_g4847 [Phytophthora fragariae]|uniref:Uncharacterized protein n=1 Tax=Phytophthora fragariae TaxID=53985 RepID=A0A6G0SB45_9STRA|nr:hypothetical protein PF008_g4847 [Phytophthora fragariae]
MIFLFPVVKLCVKRALWKYARNLHDLSADVTICMVEISGSLYQTVCINYVYSKLMVILLMALDFVQAAHEAHLYVRHDYILDSKSTLQTAVNIVESARSSDVGAEKLTADTFLVALPYDENTDEQHAVETPPDSSRDKKSEKVQAWRSAVGPVIRGNSLIAKTILFKKAFSRAVLPAPGTNKSDMMHSRTNKGEDFDDERLFRHRGVEMRGTAGISIDGVVLHQREQARILEQTLQLLFGAEVLLFVEYVEMFVPVLYSALIGGLWNLPNATYNVILMNMSYDTMIREVVTSLGYGSLEVVSFVLVYFFLKKRYGISALYQLAFLLESYAMTLQGKLVGSYIVILNSTSIHHGTDVTFKFDWDVLLRTPNPYKGDQ